MKKYLLLIAIIALGNCSSKNKIRKVFPIYGNYCGKINPQISLKLDPIDLTDFLCQERLDCIKRNGKEQTQSCDLLIIKELHKVVPRTAEQSAVTKSLIAYFKSKFVK